MPPRKTLKNILRIIPGRSKRLTNLRGRTINALKNWENAQKSNTRSALKELQLKSAAANAMSKYANAIAEEEQNKMYIGTAQNMSGNNPVLKMQNNHNRLSPTRPKYIFSKGATRRNNRK
jgi:hypothetical protein